MPSRRRHGSSRAVSRRRRARARSMRRLYGIGGSLSVGRPIIADSHITQLTYSTDFTFATTGATTQVMSHNSLYDPDVTGTGHQPRGFDQLAALYKRYYVYAARLDLQVLNNGSAPCVVVINAVAQNTGALSTVSYAAENPDTDFGIVSPLTEPLKLSMYRTSDQLFGIRTALEANFQPQVTTNPNLRSYFKIGMDSMPTANAYDLSMLVKITYFCRFDERQTLITS